MFKRLTVAILVLILSGVPSVGAQSSPQGAASVERPEQLAARVRTYLDSLHAAGIEEIFTLGRDPVWGEGYSAFLQALGYAPDPDFDGWWSKWSGDA